MNVLLCMFLRIFALNCCRLYRCWISSLALIVISAIRCFILDATATRWSAHLSGFHIFIVSNIHAVLLNYELLCMSFGVGLNCCHWYAVDSIQESIKT